MTYNSIQTISQIMARFENEVKGNPARFRNDPFYIDFLIDSVLEHPDWIPSDYVRFHEEKKGEPIRLNVRDFFSALFHNKKRWQARNYTTDFKSLTPIR